MNSCRLVVPFVAKGLRRRPHELAQAIERLSICRREPGTPSVVSREKMRGQLIGAQSPWVV
jgi:hypothetical protein